MKLIYKTFTFFMALLLTGAVFAQNADQGILNARIDKTIAIEKDGTQIPLHVKILEYRNYPETAQNQTESKSDNSATVTKLIAIDEFKDGNIEQYLVVRYQKSITDSFELKATPEGFAILVDDRELKYLHGNGVYFMNNEDQDFFTVEEFRDIL